MKDSKVVGLLNLLLLHVRSHSRSTSKVTHNLKSLCNNPSLTKIFCARWDIFCPFYLTIFLLIFLQFLTRSFFVLLGDVTLSQLRTHMYWDDGLSKNWGKKTTNLYRFYDAWLILYPASTSSSRPDQNFSVGIQRVLKTGLYLIVLFNDTFIFFLFHLCLDTWSTSWFIRLK